MRTFLAIIGAFAIIVLFSIVAIFVIGFQRAGPLLEEAHAYADESIEAIASEWNGDELASRAAPELTELLKDGALEQIMSTSSFHLGNMTSYDGSTCVITQYELNSTVGELVLAGCEASAAFVKGTANFNINILKRNDEWKILGFFVRIDEPEERGPVQVAYDPSAGEKDWSKIEVSIRKPAIRLSTGHDPLIGAGFNPQLKVDNIE